MKKESKKIEMPVTTEAKQEEQQKLSYEELEKLLAKRNAQCTELVKNLQQAEQVIASINEVELLLNILDKGTYFTDGFIMRCSDTVEKIIGEALDNADKREAALKEAKEKEEK